MSELNICKMIQKVNFRLMAELNLIKAEFKVDVCAKLFPKVNLRFMSEIIFFKRALKVNIWFMS